MAKLKRRSALLVKMEGTYGVDSVPTGAANAFLVKNLGPPEPVSENVRRDFVRAYFGNSGNIPVAISRKLPFAVELAGSGAPGTAPPWGPALRLCAFSETLLAAAHSGTATAGSTSTITLAAGASAVDNAYRGMTIRTTGGTGSGQSRVILGYVGATKVATVTENWTPAVDATTAYTIDAQALYMPVSDLMESASVYMNEDGVLRRLIGSRGTPTLTLSNKGIPEVGFNLQGLWSVPTDTALPATTLSAWQKPPAVNAVNTTGIRLHGFTGAVISELSIDMANQVVFRSLPGAPEQVLITDRQPTGSIKMESTTVAAKDWETAIKNADVGALSIQNGLTAGNIVKIDAPAVGLIDPTFDEMDGISMMTAKLDFQPSANGNGNDELTIMCR